MGYNILGINMSHNSSVCVLSNGKIVFFLEEERLSKLKHDPLPIQLFYYIHQNFQIDEISFSGLSGFYTDSYYTKIIKFILKNLFPTIPINNKFLTNHHHTHSSSAFYNSGFKKALSIIIDGNGEGFFNSTFNNEGFETETIQTFKYPLIFKEIYKSFITDKEYLNKNQNIIYSPLVSLSKVYEAVTEYLGFRVTEAGKTMGLSSYGKLNSNIPHLYKNTKGNSSIIYKQGYKPILNIPPHSKNSHTNPSEITDFKKDLAYKVQQESQQAVGDLIEKGLKETGLKQVCCAGGYFLNCVANYYLIKRFPDIEFYFEPISSDAGNAIGVAKLAWHEKTQDTTIRPQKTLYYGPKYSKQDLLKGIQKYLD